MVPSADDNHRGGTPTGFTTSFQELNAFGFEQRKLWVGIEHPDGSVAGFAALRPELRYDTETRRCWGVYCTSPWRTDLHDPSRLNRLVRQESSWPWKVLRTRWRLAWTMARLVVEGEHVPDTRVPEVLRRIHQIPRHHGRLSRFCRQWRRDWQLPIHHCWGLAGTRPHPRHQFHVGPGTSLPAQELPAQELPTQELPGRQLRLAQAAPATLGSR